MDVLCTEADLLVLEPGVFLNSGLSDFYALNRAAGTLAGTGLVLTSGSFTAAGVMPGMVAIVRLADDSAGAACEVVAAVGGSATVSLVRPRDGAAMPVALGGAVVVTVVNLRGVIDAVGRELVGLLKGVCGADMDPAAVTWGGPVRGAAAMGVLARLMRMLAATTHDVTAMPAKQLAYENAYAALRRSLVARIDADGDGRFERVAYTGAGMLERL